MILLVMLLKFCKRTLNLIPYTNLTKRASFSKLSLNLIIYHEDFSYCLIVLSVQNRKIMVNINDELASSKFSRNNSK